AQGALVGKDVADAGVGLLADANAGEHGTQAGVTNRFVSGFEKLLTADKRRTWIPKMRLIGKQSDVGFARVIAVVLMDEEIQDSFAKSEVIRRSAFALHRGVVEFEPTFGETRLIDFHDTLPGFKDVAFGERFDAFIPALLRQ